MQTQSDVAHKFQQENISKDLELQSPSHLLQVTYGTHNVQLGNSLTPTQVKDQPVVKWPHDSHALYTLVMIDPDDPCPENPENREWLHWLVINIPDCRVSEGNALADFVGSGPPQDTGFHRYVLLVFKQECPLSANCRPHLPATGTGDERENFKISDFAKEHHLGQPVAGNFFKAEWDEYVSILEAQLGDNVDSDSDE